MAIETLWKEVNEVRRFEYDFSRWPEIIGGATIASVTVTAAPATGITVGGGASSGALAQSVISGGTNGEIYVIKFEATLSTGSVIVGEGRLGVKNTTK
jgi:hypothetical protein